MERKQGSGSYSAVNSVLDTGSFKNSGLEYNTQYTYRVKFKNKYGEGPVSNEVTVTTGVNPAAQNPGKNPGSGISSSYAPQIVRVYATPASPGIATVHVEARNGYSDRYLEFYRNGTFYGQVKYNMYSGSFNLPVTYTGVTTYTVKCYSIYNGRKIYGNEMSVRATSGKLGSVKLACTKISRNIVNLSWSANSGASGYYIYAGKKLVKKTSGSQIKYKGKKAGGKSFTVVPYVNVGGKIYAGSASNKATPKPNLARFVNHKKYYYGTCPFIIKKVSLKGKTYTITGHAVNNRIFKMKKYRKLKISVTTSGKIAFSKTWRNLSVNVGGSSSKRLVLKAKGKAGIDLRTNCSYYASWKPIW